MRGIAIMMAAILAVGTVLAVGLTVLPSSVQKAQAQGIPCDIFPADIDADEISNNCDFHGNTEIDASSDGSILPRPILGGSGGNPCNIDTLDIDAEEVENNCDFYGNTKIDASSELPIRPCDPLDPLCGIRPGEIIELPSDD